MSGPRQGNETPWQHPAQGFNQPTPNGGRTPAPPYRTPAPPTQRLAEARVTAGRTPRSSANPDGTPAPLPLTATTNKGGVGAAGKVVQRFSGSGLVPKAKAQKQERRARRATLVLASVALVLIVSTAFVIFDPAVQLPGFGFALGQRILQVDSGIPLLLPGTEPPSATPTPPPGEVTPTPTPNGATGPTDGTPTPTPTVNPQATATPKPTATPTVTPTVPVPPNGASVTFTAVKQTVQSSPSTIRACPGGSGCDMADTTIGGQKDYYQTGTPTYDNYSSASTYTGTAQFTIGCDMLGGAGSGCFYSNGAAKAGSCGPYSIALSTRRTQQSFSCTLNTYTNPNGQSGTVATWTDPYGNSDFVEWTLNGFTGSNYVKHYTISYNDCHSAMDATAAQGTTWANGVISGAESGQQVVSNPSVTHGNWNCNPGIGYGQYGYFTFQAWSTTYISGGLVFNRGTALNVAAGRLALPASYAWNGNVADCNSKMSWSVSGNNITITCQDSRPAIYDWSTSTSSGQQAQQRMLNNIAGKSLSVAQSYCNNDPGVVNGTCKITLNGGNMQVLPSDPSKIVITAS